MDADKVVGVEVPASTANVGPGFDVLAAAVDLRLTAWTTERGDERVEVVGEGAGEIPTGDSNLIWRMFVAYCERFGVEPPDVGLRATSEIPLERGLGSSAAAAVAGVTLARALTGAGGRDQDLIDLVADKEGHADNAAAAVLGGIVAVVDGRARRFEPGRDLAPVLCIPEMRQSTTVARGILPEFVSLADAAGNAGRAAVVLAGLTGSIPLDSCDMRDVLHEPSRFEVMPESGRLVHALRADGIATCLSGAGPAVLALTGVSDRGAADRVREVAGRGWTVRASRWDRAGAAVCPPTVVPG